MIVLFTVIITIGLLAFPVFVAVKEFLTSLYLAPGEEKDRHKDTKPLRFYKKFIETIIHAVIRGTRSFSHFLSERKMYKIPLIIMWCLNFNVPSLVTIILAVYIYFSCTYDFIVLPSLLYKIFADFLIFFIHTPVFIYVSIALKIYADNIRVRALNTLYHNEMKNRGFINSQPLAIMCVGTMGAKKTTTIVDIALSTSIMFRDKALDILIKYDMRFPNFPWLRLEEELKKCIEHHTVFNLASCKEYVEKKRYRFYQNPSRRRIWGYDYTRYKMEYDNELEVIDIFDAVSTYAQAYLIYTVSGSLIISNMPVREDFRIDGGYLPLVDSSIFGRSAKESLVNSRFSRILDYDMLRLGKKMIEDNKNSNALEFGIVLMVEIGKERKNMLENNELKKKTEECNQKNDLFNTRIKMGRNGATVDYYPFIRYLLDEQRPQSLGADARELASIIDVSNCSELQMAYNSPLYSFIHNVIYPKFLSLYIPMRNLRGDNTLLMHLLKNMQAYFEYKFESLENRYGYYEVICGVQMGTLDSKPHKCKYYLAKNKIHKKRFPTDSFADIFYNMSYESGVGINDFEEYADINASEEEMKKQNSYFYKDMNEWRKNRRGG